ncbi:toll-like protein [Leptotrombidium deliense]|uniref:Toll-like protein n=1 Tax=Leptotrombidium deliense TaxID=299467 RepID=A0A443SIL2_9ACAR|nr:toll-like protein [Leptotrombidium deliense]
MGLFAIIAVTAILLSSIVRCVDSVQYVAPGECTWTHVSATNFDVTLQCNVGTISPKGLNFSLIQAEHTISLKLICDDYLYESRLEDGSLNHLRFLRSLTIENCKLQRLSTGALLGLQQLRNLTISTHNEAWGVMSLQLSHESLLHLKFLELLDLGFNNFANLPEDLFCPLTNLKVLNLTHNQLQGFSSLGVVDHTTGHLCLQELQQLDLSFNRIKFLTETGVASLKNLRALYLQNNRISDVAELSLSALSKLQIIDLSSNQLTSIPPRTFRASEELRQLHLQNNSLNYLQPGLFTGLSKLLVLNLSYNQIGSEWITPDTFADLIRVVILDLSHNRLSKINTTTFQSQYSLQILYLQHNEIEQIGDHSFAALYNLHTLILSNNRLKSLDAFSLNGLYVLSKVSVGGNELSAIHEEAFRNCSNLQDLDLHSNKLTSVPKAVQSLQKLKTLQLSDNSISDVRNASYLGLQHLQTLNVSGNQVVNLTRGSLKDLPALRYLDISRCALQHLEHGVFDDAPSLVGIYLQNNKMTDINGLFMNLQNLQVLNVSHNSITWFDYALIPKELLRLDIQNNEIETIGNYFELETGLQLKYMNAAFNLIREMSASSIPNQIETLILRNNKISVIQPFAFVAKHNVTLVDLRNNSLSNLDINALRLKAITSTKPLPNFHVSENPYLCDCNMEWLQRINSLDSTRQYPKIVDLDAVTCKLPFHRETPHIALMKANSSNFLCKYRSHCFALCHCCDFDACDCEMMCPENCTCYYDQTWSTNIVDCSAKGYTGIPARIPMDVTELYLDGNDINTLTSHTFIGRKNLRVLYLNNSNVHHISNRTFNGLQFLQVLHLEFNKLTALYGYEFDSLPNLQELHLHHNHISAINNKTFSYLKSLQILHLENNAIVDYQIWNLNQNSRLTEVYLSHNLWSCKCDFMETFQDWLQVFGSFVKDGDEVRCYFNRTSVGPYLLEFNALHCSNFSDHQTNDGGINNDVSFFPHDLLRDKLPLLITLASVLLVAIIVFVCLCVHRKELQVWIYSKYGVRFFQKPRYSTDTEKLFDAFVSYCKKDEAFIAQILAPELECGHPPYRLCLRYRDLPVTGYVAEAITEAIESSHRTIILLSEQFLKSESCRFELKVAHHECQVNRNHELIVVLLDKCLSQLDPEAKMCLRSAPIIHWGDRRFWEKLRYSMPSGRGQKPMNCPDVRASLEFKRAMNMHVNAV